MTDTNKRGYPLSMIAGLFKLDEAKTQQLAKDGIIPKAENGLYDLIACVRSYITHLRDKPMTMTKAEIASHLDMSERNLTDVLRGLNLDYRTADVEEIRIAYIRDLREKAAGRGGDHQIESTLARTRKDTAQATLYEIQIAEKAGQLVPVAKIEPFITSRIIAARQYILSFPHKWSQELKALNGLDIEESYFEYDLTDALNQLSEFDPSNPENDDAAGNESMGSASKTQDFDVGNEI